MNGWMNRLECLFLSCAGSSRLQVLRRTTPSTPNFYRLIGRGRGLPGEIGRPTSGDSYHSWVSSGSHRH